MINICLDVLKNCLKRLNTTLINRVVCKQTLDAVSKVCCDTIVPLTQK